LRGQAACSVDNDPIGPPSQASLHRIKSNGGGVSFRLGNDIDPISAPPLLQLLLGRGTKGIARCEQHPASSRLPMVSEFANGSGLARPIDAHHHENHGLLLGSAAQGVHGIQTPIR